MKHWSLLIILLIGVVKAFCQGLETVPPVLADTPHVKIDDKVSFILTADLRHFLAGPGTSQYLNCLEIIDADQPWPPRWYFPGKKYNTIPEMNDSSSKKEEILFDARYQNGYITFSKGLAGDYKPIYNFLQTTEYLVCNKKMEVVDSLKNTGMPINAQDFRINAKKEKLFMVRKDTVLNLSNASGNEDDSAILSTIDIIEILDSASNLIFRWNPFEKLGASAIYFPYGNTKSLFISYGHFDWSHGNSVSWDFDGNILYSFRHIGIGKISRKDGHLIWHIERNNIPLHTPTGDIAFYRQGALDKNTEDGLYNFYTLYSNGDQYHPSSYGLQFGVNKENSGIKFIKKQTPENNLWSLAAGNYEIETNGDYLLNYGIYIMETNDPVVFMEYGNQMNKLYARYSFPGSINAYQVHELEDWRPPRPVITRQNNSLMAQGEMKEWTWYKLSGPYNTIVEKVGDGSVFQPKESGVYCVAGNYGIGYAISLLANYKL